MPPSGGQLAPRGLQPSQCPVKPWSTWFPVVKFWKRWNAGRQVGKGRERSSGVGPGRASRYAAGDWSGCESGRRAAAGSLALAPAPALGEAAGARRRWLEVQPADGWRGHDNGAAVLGGVYVVWRPGLLARGMTLGWATRPALPGGSPRRSMQRWRPCMPLACCSVACAAYVLGHAYMKQVQPVSTARKQQCRGEKERCCAWQVKRQDHRCRQPMDGWLELPAAVPTIC